MFQEEHAGHVDQYLVYSKDYKTIREAVAKAVIEGRAQSIDEAVKVIFLFLSLFYVTIFCFSGSDFIYSILYHLFIDMSLYSKKKGLLYPSGPFPRRYQSISSSQSSHLSQTRGLRF